MTLFDKIEQIRQKPEHIRLRYVWVCVVISMVFVVFIWAISLKNRNYQVQTSGEVAGQASIFDELKKQKESLGQYQQEMSDIKGNIQQGLQNAQEQQAVQDQPSASSKEGFSGGGSPQNALPASNPASLFQ
jgi:hypothetical protein